MVTITGLEIAWARIQQAVQVFVADQPELCDLVEPRRYSVIFITEEPGRG